MSSTRRKIRGAGRTKQPRGPNNEPLCRWCRKLVMPPKRTFCSPECVHEWQLRSSGSYLRKCLFERDKGICAECNLDTTEITKGFRRPLKGETVSQWELRVAVQREKYGIPRHRKTYWDADHILSVCEGGGLTGLENFQTMCCRCHLIKSNELLKRRREARAAVKKPTTKSSSKKKPKS